VPWLPNPEQFSPLIEKTVVQPLLKELQKRKITYTGWLYVGLMMTDEGPKVVEFNVRLGDPEAQVLAVADERDWLAMIATQCGLDVGNQRETRPFAPRAAVAVVMAASGYPFEDPREHASLPASILEGENANTLIFAASLSEGNAGNLTTGRGRVLTAVCADEKFTEARRRVYERVDQLLQHWPTAQIRRDIGAQL